MTSIVHDLTILGKIAKNSAPGIVIVHRRKLQTTMVIKPIKSVGIYYLPVTKSWQMIWSPGIRAQDYGVHKAKNHKNHNSYQNFMRGSVTLKYLLLEEDSNHFSYNMTVLTLSFSGF